jgi:hypothetical protein
MCLMFFFSNLCTDSFWPMIHRLLVGVYVNAKLLDDVESKESNINKVTR